MVSRATKTSKTGKSGNAGKSRSGIDGQGTVIQRCVQDELKRYFDLLDGQPPHDLHRMVMQQTETALLTYVMQECCNNQSKAATWLGISRGTLRGRLADIYGD